jgi:hypothetical protein
MYVCITQENLIGITLSKYDWLISIWKNLFVNSFFFSASSNNQKDAAYMNDIKSISPSRISLKYPHRYYPSRLECYKHS